MNNRIRLRLVALTGAIGLMGLVIVFMTLRSQQQAGGLRARLNAVDSESFQIADNFKDSLRQLNSSLNRFGSTGAAPELEKFREASRALDDWIDTQKPRLTTAQEQALMQQIDAAYTNYLEAANELIPKIQAAGQRRTTMDDYSGVMKAAQALFDFGQALSRAHYQSRGLVLAQANHAIRELRILVLVSLAGLFVLGAVLAVFVHRDMIAPLRVKLVESETLWEHREKLASLGLLAAGVAHEIRNPLTAIKAAVFIQQKRLQPGTPEHADVKLVEREILRLERIVSDFLLFARPNDPDLKVIPVDVPLQEVRDLLGPPLARNSIQLVLEESPPLRIRVDAAQIKQVLINLVQNAADAIGSNGVVTLRARAVRKRIAGADAPGAVLEVEDNGPGIPPKVQERLFDPFFTTKDNGTGLGLSIAAGIVQKHGGTLQYQTQVDHGTTFGIILPQAAE